MIKNKTIEHLGALVPWSEAAARRLGRYPAKWVGFEFSATPGEGMHVTGRTGTSGKTESAFVPLSDVR